ncbi:alpha/beta-hydrolase [Gloeophyllum trabeum ATCC 11539]|uniref:Alpha/beta-hydrolase n=1 Tax=Gloeophyllum trabeum (strain ATCC 11539 / FP-39264 / Madison 617) TaxID=670483 RepID=S7PZ19_GLOTA|nr:alpha/beta-hydrolase [Gloeophyllum trabeum ATCC 11539]EPQ52512.1 alpha/beta-hydrolase [Gloeophyllum trabeum ATCC 11539]
MPDSFPAANRLAIKESAPPAYLVPSTEKSHLIFPMSTPLSSEALHLNLKLGLRQRHVQQLSQIGDDYKFQEDLDPDKKVTVEDLMRWTTHVQKEFDAAIAQKVFGKKGIIDWRNALFTLLESTAMYLRDDAAVQSAINAAKAGNTDQAMEYLREADDDINKIAEFWGLEYMTICDLIEKTPDGQRDIVGPFCGAFSAKNPRDPFLGIAFKGTSATSEWGTDLAREPQATGDSFILWGADVSRGVFNALFGTFGDYGIPMDHILVYIQQYMNQLPTGSSELVVHSTGHSLGASFTTLCYAQLLQYQQTKPLEWVLGDLFTFGSPRIGENSFALNFRAAVEKAAGSSWRIVDEDDSVTSLPPAPAKLVLGIFPAVDDPRIYVHVDSAYRTSRSEPPSAISSEVGMDPGPAPKTVEELTEKEHMQDHSPAWYYESLLKANGLGPLQ